MFNSAYSEAIYEERARKRIEKEYSTDIIQFKPNAVLDSAGRIIRPAMKWRVFDNRMYHFINDNRNANELAEDNRLMELKILYAISGRLPDIQGVNWAAENGRLDVLKWIREQPRHLLPNPYGIDLAAGNGHLDVLKWVYEQNPDPNTLPPLEGVNWIAGRGHLEVLKWIYEKTGVLPDAEGADEAKRNGYQDVVDWLATHNVFPSI